MVISISKNMSGFGTFWTSKVYLLLTKSGHALPKGNSGEKVFPGLGPYKFPDDSRTSLDFTHGHGDFTDINITLGIHG